MRWGVALGLALGTGCQKSEAPQSGGVAPSISTSAAPEPAHPEPAVDASEYEGLLVNPFLTQEERQVAAPVASPAPLPGEAASLPEGPIQVEAIVYSRDPSKSRAIMGGRIVRPGDRLGHARLVRIERDAVVVIDEEGAQRELVVPLERLPGQR